MLMVDPEEVKEILCDQSWLSWDEIAEMVDSAQMVDAVPVVRCKDCKHRRKNEENEPYCALTNGLTGPWDDEFCSYGERRDL